MFGEIKMFIPKNLGQTETWKNRGTEHNGNTQRCASAKHISQILISFLFETDIRR